MSHVMLEHNDLPPLHIQVTAVGLRGMGKLGVVCFCMR